MPPRSAAACLIAWPVDAASVTSHSIATALAPASATAASSRSRRRAMSATCAPRWASPIPMQRPSPLDAPTMTVLTMDDPPVGLLRCGNPRRERSSAEEPGLDDVQRRVDRRCGTLADADGVHQREQHDTFDLGIAEAARPEEPDHPPPAPVEGRGRVGDVVALVDPGIDPYSDHGRLARLRRVVGAEPAAERGTTSGIVGRLGDLHQ